MVRVGVGGFTGDLMGVMLGDTVREGVTGLTLTGIPEGLGWNNSRGAEVSKAEAGGLTLTGSREGRISGLGGGTVTAASSFC